MTTEITLFSSLRNRNGRYWKLLFKMQERKLTTETVPLSAMFRLHITLGTAIFFGPHPLICVLLPSDTQMILDVTQ